MAVALAGVAIRRYSQPSDLLSVPDELWRRGAEELPLRGGCFVNPGRGAMWGGLVGLPVVTRRGREFAVAEAGAVSGCVGARSAPLARSSRDR